MFGRIAAYDLEMNQWTWLTGMGEAGAAGMAEGLDVGELRRLSDRLRAEARHMADSRLKHRMAEAALVLAEIAEAMNRREAGLG
jgi:hypothetical protein